MPTFRHEIPKEALREITPEEFFKGIQTTKLIEIIKTDNKINAMKATRSLLHRVFSRMQRMQRVQKMLHGAAAETNAKLIDDLLRIFLALTASAHEINETFKKQDAGRLELLYPVVFLEAALRQIPEPNRLVNDYSFGSVLKTELQEQTIVQKLQLQSEASRAYTVQYAKMGEKALTPIIQEHWYSFLKNMGAVSNQNLQQQFAHMMLNLAGLDVLPIWLNITFEQTYKKYGPNAQRIAEALLMEYNNMDTFIQQIQKLHAFLSSFDTASFEAPASLTQSANLLIRNIKSLETPQFTDTLNTAQGLKLFISLQAMHKAVETLDTSIKTLTASTSFDERRKVIVFKNLLTQYFNLLKTWTNIPRVKEMLSNMMPEPKYDTDHPISIDQYLRTIAIALGKTGQDSKELDSSPTMNVAAARMINVYDLSINIPASMTLEDIFTLIHQNLLVILSSLTPLPDTGSLPFVFNEVINQISDIRINKGTSHYSRNEDQYAEFIGASFIGDKLVYYYNFPLRSHSNTFEVAYDLNTHQVSLTVQAFGGNEWHRWDEFGDLAYLMCKLTGMKMQKAVEIDDEKRYLTFTWEINNPAQAYPAKALIQERAYQSMNEYDPLYTLKETDPRYKINRQEKPLSESIAEMTQKPVNYIFDTACELISEHPFLFSVAPETEEGTQKQRACFSAAAEKLVASFVTSDKFKQEQIFFIIAGAYSKARERDYLARYDTQLKKLILDDPFLIRGVLERVITNEINLQTDSWDILGEIINVAEDITHITKLRRALQVFEREKLINMAPPIYMKERLRKLMIEKT